MPSVSKLRLTFELTNHRLNEHALLEHHLIIGGQRLRLHVLANLVNQVNVLGFQSLSQLLGNIPLIGNLKFAKYRLRQLFNGHSVIYISGGELSTEEVALGVDE